MIRDYGDRALLIDCDSTSAVAALAAALTEFDPDQNWKEVTSP